MAQRHREVIHHKWVWRLTQVGEGPRKLHGRLIGLAVNIVAHAGVIIGRCEQHLRRNGNAGMRLIAVWIFGGDLVVHWHKRHIAGAPGLAHCAFANAP